MNHKHKDSIGTGIPAKIPDFSLPLLGSWCASKSPSFLSSKFCSPPKLDFTKKRGILVPGSHVGSDLVFLGKLSWIGKALRQNGLSAKGCSYFLGHQSLHPVLTSPSEIPILQNLFTPSIHPRTLTWTRVNNSRYFGKQTNKHGAKLFLSSNENVTAFQTEF